LTFDGRIPGEPWGENPLRPFRGEQAVVSSGLPEMPQERRRPNVRCRRGVWGGALAPLMQGAGEALHSPATLRRSGKDSGGATGAEPAPPPRASEFQHKAGREAELGGRPPSCAATDPAAEKTWTSMVTASNFGGIP